MKNNSSFQTFLVIVASIAAISALLSAGFTYYSILSVQSAWLTGFASQTNATINLTVTPAISVNFTNNSINWGSGYVTSGLSQANLTTNAGGGTISAVGGTWSINGASGSGGFVVENIGNVNASLHLKTGKNATSMINGTGPVYQFNITNIEATSCLNYSGGTGGGGTAGLTNLTTAWYDVNITDPGTAICGRFPFADAQDTIRIDIRLTVPYDSANGTMGDVVTLSYCQAPGPC